MRIRKPSRVVLLILLFAALTVGTSLAQPPGITTPPAGDNQRSVTTQYMGFVAVTVDYNSPDVHAPNGGDRSGKIWGTLVPWGMKNLGFGTATESPWRVGANQNTTITFSHDVEIEGQALAAGTYGLHMAPGEEEWQIIFSNNSTSWGSFFYDPTEDALRVTVKSEPAPYREWMSFEFLDRQLDTTLVALEWENLRVPFRVSLPDMVGLYIAKIEDELRNAPGFSWQSWQGAAQYLLQRDTEGKHLDKALAWAEFALSSPFPGQENLQTLQTKARVLDRMGNSEEALATLTKGLDHPTATVFQVHQIGRGLLAQGRSDVAMMVFQHNAQRFPDTWPINVGLARGYKGVGDNAKALEHAKKALQNAPDDLNRQALAGMVEQLEAAVSGK